MVSPESRRRERMPTMHRFLSNNRDELIARCMAKVAERPRRAATAEQLKNGIPLFLEQLIRTLHAEEDGEAWESLKISGASGGDVRSLSEIGVGATAHGKQLMDLGYTVDQVVHDYGDLCQAITDLAVERDAPVSVDEFRTLNRCLDNGIADAVSSFSSQRDERVEAKKSAEDIERLGFLAHELHDSLQTATLAFAALQTGNLSVTGATGGVLKRSLTALTTLVESTLTEVRFKTHAQQRPVFSLASFIADAKNVAALDASARGRAFVVAEVDPHLAIAGNRDLLLAALANLLHNAFKFSRGHSDVSLSAYAVAERVSIDVKDSCGGLPTGSADTMFMPFTQGGDDQFALGLGLFIARQSVEADGGGLSVRDVPGVGCVFTISLPLHKLH